MTPALAAKIAKAKGAGYSDGEIASFLAQSDPTLAPKITAAKTAGYDDAEIIGHLTTAGGRVNAPSAPSKPKVQQDAERRVASTPNALRAFDAGVSWGGIGDLDALSAGAETGVRNALAGFGIGTPAGYTAAEARKAVKAANVEADNAFQKDHPLASMGLNVAGAMAAPGAGALGRFIGKGATSLARVGRAGLVGAGTGGTYGALTAGEGERAKGALSGAATGALFGAGGQSVLGKVFGAQPAKTGAARELSRKGTILTPGQMIGGLAKSVEDKLTSAPMTGYSLGKARTRGLDSYRRSTIDQALEPIGVKLSPKTDTGNAGYAEAEKAVSDAYEAFLPKLTFQADNQFATDFLKLGKDIDLLPKERGNQVTRILREKVLSPLTSGKFDGKGRKQDDSELGRLGANYRSSADADQREVGRVLQDTQTVLRDWMARANPGQAPEIRKANEAWANIVRLREATGGSGANSAGGEWTPAQLLAATRRADKSVGKGATARGEALMQDWAQKGQEVLPNKVPDSGTAGRALATGGLLTGAALNPFALKAAVVDAAGAAFYSKPVQAAMNKIYRATDRPTAKQGLVDLKKLAAAHPMLKPVVERIEVRLGVAAPAVTRTLGRETKAPTPEAWPEGATMQDAQGNYYAANGERLML